MTIELRVACEFERPSRPIDYATALDLSARELGGRLARSAHITTSSDDFNDWVGRSLSDIVMMTSETTNGPYPYAGIPWFSTVFGRDGLITALQMLWVQPALARGVLGYLAATQATQDEPERDAQPGKILHEVRHGEMAARMEIPFGRYYGSHDATPLFVVLAEAYYRAHGGPGLHRAAVAEHRARPGLDRRSRRSRRRRLHRVRAPHAHGAGPSGLEGLERRGLPRRWQAGRGTDRPLRAAGLRVRRPPGRRHPGRCARSRRARLRAPCAGRDAPRAVSRRRSGSRSSAPTASRSTARSGCAVCGPRTRATACSAASSARSGQRRSRTSC